MQYGENIVYYTPVEAYPVMTMDVGIISGGTGDNNVVVQSTRFFWVYDPDNQEVSGFTGKGWFTDTPNTPLYQVNEKQLLSEFQNGTRTNLIDYFIEWQEIVSSQTPETDYVRDFVFCVGADCVSFNVS